MPENTVLSEMSLMELYNYLASLDSEELDEVKGEFEKLAKSLDIFAVAHLHNYMERNKKESLGLYIHCNANVLSLRDKLVLINDFKTLFERNNEQPLMISLP